MSQEANNLRKPPKPPPANSRETIIIKKKVFTLMNMQMNHRGVAACLKNRCFCFQQLIVQTTSDLSVSLSVCLRRVRLTASNKYGNRVDMAPFSAPWIDEH